MVKPVEHPRVAAALQRIASAPHGEKLLAARPAELAISLFDPLENDGMAGYYDNRRMEIGLNEGLSDAALATELARHLVSAQYSDLPAAPLRGFANMLAALDKIEAAPNGPKLLANVSKSISIELFEPDTAPGIASYWAPGSRQIGLRADLSPTRMAECLVMRLLESQQPAATGVLHGAPNARLGDRLVEEAGKAARAARTADALSTLRPRR